MALSKQFSDHNILSINANEIRLSNLNLGQTGKLKMFPRPDGFAWSCTYRTVDILTRIQQHEKELLVIGNELLAIARTTELSIADRNDRIKTMSIQIIPKLEAMGFQVKSYIMELETYGLFNKGANREDMLKNPEQYLNGPGYYLEDSESYLNRLETAFSTLMLDRPDIIACQEIEFGTINGINFSHAQKQISERYPEYRCISNTVKDDGYDCLTVTYYNSNVVTPLIDSSNDEIVQHCAMLHEKVKEYVRDPSKLQILSFKHNNTGNIIYLINIHADYNKLNTPEPWSVLRELLQTYKNLIITGDFNVQLKNRHLIDNALENLHVKSVILKTPEPENFNPTYDGIFSN